MANRDPPPSPENDDYEEIIEELFQNAEPDQLNDVAYRPSSNNQGSANWKRRVRKPEKQGLPRSMRNRVRKLKDIRPKQQVQQIRWRSLRRSDLLQLLPLFQSAPNTRIMPRPPPPPHRPPRADAGPLAWVFYLMIRSCQLQPSLFNVFMEAEDVEEIQFPRAIYDTIRTELAQEYGQNFPPFFPEN